MSSKGRKVANSVNYINVYGNVNSEGRTVTIILCLHYIEKVYENPSEKLDEMFMAR